MNEIILPPSPNWYLSNILACASDGTVAWGARNCVVIGKARDGSKQLDYSIIDKAHTDKVTSIAFSPQKEENGFHRLVSGGDDNTVKIWNLKNLSMELNNSKLNSNQKVIGVDWSKYNPNFVYFVSEDGLLVVWNISYNASRLISLGKLTATCLACCPHDSNIVSIGSKSGLIYIVDVRGSGNVVYKLRGHDVEVVSLSWCPVPINVLDNKNNKDLLLASGAKDRLIFLWKAGSDGRYQTQITFPSAPLDLSSHKNKVSASAGNYTAVCWLESTTLFTSSPWGELLLWDLSVSSGSTKKKFTPKLIHAKHGKGLFSITGLANDLIEQSEKNEDEKWKEKIDIKAIWTLAQDRQVICSSITDNEPLIEFQIPTQGGFVYCMSACPVDTSQIAFGVGDAMIRLWNLSEPHDNILEIQMLWEKIKGKVRALSWHPEKENLLAFATNEGRVGIYDTNKKLPILGRQYHRHVVYSIDWAPAPNVKEYALYTCGDGELVYYNPEKFNDNPITVTKKKECTEFCWKPDYSLIALGFGDGSITFLNNDLSECGHTIHALNKAVQCLVWHPESTSSDLNISIMQNYLAAAVNNSIITVFEIFNTNKTKENSDSSFYRTVATLNAHSDKVVCLAWSPHISGYLVSGSYDYTAQVWKVETQEVIATYTSHLGPIQCCMWSPFSQNLIITGSVDFTLRIWNISNQKVIKNPSEAKISSRSKRTKKKKGKESIINDNSCTEIETGSKADDNMSKLLLEDKKEMLIHTQNSEETEDLHKNTTKTMKKKKPKKLNYFPKHSAIANDNNLWCNTIRNLLDMTKNDGEHDDESGVFDCNGIEHSQNKNYKTEEVPILLGNKKNLEDALNYEKNILNLNEQYNCVTEIDLWTGNLKENLQEAMKNKRLSDFLVSLAPTISKDFWEKMCEAYAAQLIFEENLNKAVSYLLCINKIHDAIDIFINAKLYKEAYVLASCKLDSKDPVIENILTKWASNAYKDGHFQYATECYVKLKDYTKAAKMLERRKDINSLILAIEIAEAAKDFDLSISLANKAILEALLNSDIAIARSIIKKHPQVQYSEVQIEVFKELNKALDNFNDETILNWLKGTSNIALLERLNTQFPKCPKNYLLLHQKDCFPLPSNQKMVQINVSHQLGLSVLCDQQKRMHHILKAFDIILQYEKNNSANTTDKFSLLIKYISLLENRILMDSSSIFNNDDNAAAKSLRAYLFHALINWFHESKLNEDQISECINLIIVILEKCIKDLLDKEAVKFWTMENEINKLEKQLSSILGNMQNTENNVDESKSIIERLNVLKNNRKGFLETRVSSPNPLFSYGAVMEFISKISNEQTRQTITELVMNTWKKAIS